MSCHYLKLAAAKLVWSSQASFVHLMESLSSSCWLLDYTADGIKLPQKNLRATCTVCILYCLRQLGKNEQINALLEKSRSNFAEN